MKQLFVTGILCIAGIILSQKSQSQINGPIGWQDIQDTSWIDYGDKMVDFAPNGGAFTPKGTMKVLVIYAGLYEPGVFNEVAGQADLYNWPTNGTFPYDQHNTINGVPEDIFFSSASQLSDPQYANKRNLTRYYYEMSKNSATPLILLGDVFRDPIPSSPTYGLPVRINVNPSGATSWSTLNQRVLQKLYTLYGSYWTTMWQTFDMRTNTPQFDYDNSTSAADNKIDLIIIQWRYSKNWVPQPILGMNSWSWSGNAVASTLINSSVDGHGYDFGTGFSVFSGEVTGEGSVGFFPHEIAHELYNCPHLMGANSTLGNHFYRPDAGWGMMSSNNRAMMCANSWERWLLGWNELVSNGENTDLQSVADLNSTGIYTVRDFLTTGDMIRVKVPQTTNTYLWIENHVKTNLFDYKLWAGGAPSPQGETIPVTDPGVYMFVENVAPSRENFTLSAIDGSSDPELNMIHVNAIKPLNAQGNYDYTRSALPLESPAGTIDPSYYWNNEVYTFQRTNENPISGTNPWYMYIDDYRKYVNGVYSAPPNGIINIPSDFNGCPGCETKAIVRETDGTNTNMLYENTFGRNNEAINTFGRRSDAFQAADEISNSGIVPALNIPTFPNGSVKEYVLNGLRVDVLTKDPVTGTVTIKVQFDDYELRNNKRWTGKIGLNDLTNNSSPDLTINQNVELRIDKSGTNNRTTLLNSQFIDPSIFSCYNNSYLLQLSGSNVIVENGSTLQLKTGSKYHVGSGAVLRIKTSSTLIMESGSQLIVDDGGSVIIENSANFNFNGGTINLVGNNSLLDIAGVLNIANSTNFTFTGNGYIRLSNPQVAWNYCNIDCGTNSTITLNGTGQTDKILEIDQEAFYTPSTHYNTNDLANLTITNGLVDMKSATAMLGLNGDNTALLLNQVKFTPLSSSVRTTHRGVHIYGQTNISISNCTFEKGTYGVYGWLSYSYGSPFTVLGCNFIDNQYGLFYHDKQVQAISCVFSKNYYGFYAEYTTDNNNLINGCTFSASPNGNTAPIRYINCTGNILVSDSYINYATSQAVYTSGSHYYNMVCSNITGVAGIGYALYLYSGPSLFMNSYPSGKNYIAAKFPIRLTAANNFNIESGANYLNRLTGGYHISGTVTAYPCSIPATNNATMNQWVGTISNSVKKFACQAELISVITSPTTTFGDCNGGSSPQNSQNSSSSFTTNATYLNGVSSMQSAETTGNWSAPFNSFNQILSGTVPQQTIANVMLWENSWENMRNCLKEMYSAKQLTGTGNSQFTQTITANAKMQQLQWNNYYRKFQIELEKATLYRMAGDYSTAITLLTPMVNDTSVINREQAESWLCIVQLEKQITEGTITPNEIEEARANCPMYSETTTKGMSFEPNETNNPQPETGNKPWLHAMPNPINESSVIAVNTVSENESVIEITDIFGRLVKSIKVQGGYNEVQIPRSELSKGIYTISLMQNGQKVAVSGMTVVE